MRQSTCAEYVRELAAVAEREGDSVLAANIGRVAELLDLHGCASPAAAELDERDTQPVRVLDQAVCPRCGTIVGG